MFAQFSARFKDLGADFYRHVQPTPLENGKLLLFNHTLAEQLQAQGEHADWLNVLSHGDSFAQYKPIATIYSGHQFGSYNPQLGDGRGLLIAEVIDRQQQIQEIHLKGAGLTPFSRQGDGRAVLRSSIREYLASEAMHHLGIGTTRALALTTSQTAVYREQVEQGATVARVAPSHLRFGHFEYFSYTDQSANLDALIDFTIEHYYPAAKQHPNPTLGFFLQVAANTARLIAQWQSIGFCHGVMNTDNMSILGITFDYGPFAFMDDYQPNYICNHSDYQGRYAYNRQPNIGQWNLAALGNALKPRLSDEQVREGLIVYADEFAAEQAKQLRARIGLQTTDEADRELLSDFLQLLASQQLDFNQSFRQLTDEPQQLLGIEGMPQWQHRWAARLNAEHSSVAIAQQAMHAVNPIYTLRNYLAQNAITQSELGDYSELQRLNLALQTPFTRHSQFNDYEAKVPNSGKGMSISCSS